MRSLFLFIQRLTSRWPLSTRSRLTLKARLTLKVRTAQLVTLLSTGVLLLLLLTPSSPTSTQPTSPQPTSHQPLDETLIPTRLTQRTPSQRAQVPPTIDDSQKAFAVSPQATPSELRGVWITNVASNVLFAPWGISRAINQLADLHFNTVYPVVWNRGKTFYHSPTFKQLTGHAIAPLMALMHPSEDPLAEIVRLGHRQHLRVIPWFEYGFMVPLQSKLARQHPEWLTTRSNGSRRLHESSLTGDTEPNQNPVQNVVNKLLAPLLSSGAPSALGWLNPLHPEVQKLIIDLVEEVVSQYDVEGIQFDDHFSLPVDFGYDPYTVSLYQLDHNGQSPPENSDDPDWIRWRADQFSKFVGVLHAHVKERCSACLFSVSPNPAKFAYRFHLQDWQTWLSNDWVDELVVQVYRDDMDSFDAELAKETLHSAMDQIPVSIGVLTGTWRRPISFEQIKQQVISSRDHHFSGVTFFYWDTLWSYFTPESPQQRRQNFRELLG